MPRGGTLYHHHSFDSVTKSSTDSITWHYFEIDPFSKLRDDDKARGGSNMVIIQRLYVMQA